MVPDVRFELTTYRLQGADSHRPANTVEHTRVPFNKPECEAECGLYGREDLDSGALVRTAAEHSKLQKVQTRVQT